MGYVFDDSLGCSVNFHRVRQTLVRVIDFFSTEALFDHCFVVLLSELLLSGFKQVCRDRRDKGIQLLGDGVDDGYIVIGLLRVDLVAVDLV